MRRGFVVGAVLGGLVAVGLGVAIARVTTTPTWALWQIKVALDRDDLVALRGMVDFPAVAGRAVSELASGSGDDVKGRRDEPALNWRDLAGTLLSGGKVLTVFNDPDRPLRLDGRDFLAAWWSMRREGDLATLSVDTGGREVSLVLGRDASGQWRIVGVTPLSALLRLKAPEKQTRRGRRRPVTT